MTDTYLWSGQDRMLTVEDMENVPDDEFRYELDDGGADRVPGPVHAASAGSHPPGLILSAASPAGLVVLAGVGDNIARFQHRVPGQTAHLTGDEENRAVRPFPVSIVPSKLVTLS